ncbi:DUF1353 domain-containing protein [Pseudoalteromonas sp. C2R02]|uniref:DUF1353 domain-containing protein n=1 Tax=Pseudoalteromonas sp. C2R02 TaxID=2841565 RepID=UPI001C09680C|nr:DUF1353 domain-containing protein [Pseudoalteromonas sp. C2R02]MBU2968800.1 DUF1353 domain-containing protein [Pseudoalteromonas sp. C2R02]
MKSKKLNGRFIAGGRFELSQSLNTRYGLVPFNFVTDGFSIPWFLRWFHSPFGIGVEAAVMHDYLLSIGDKFAHAIFFKLMIQYKVPYWKALIMFCFVVTYHAIKNCIKLCFPSNSA